MDEMLPGNAQAVAGGLEAWAGEVRPLGLGYVHSLQRGAVGVEDLLQPCHLVAALVVFELLDLVQWPQPLEQLLLALLLHPRVVALEDADALEAVGPRDARA